MTDTVKRVARPAATEVVETLDRAELVAVQTPQAFRRRRAAPGPRRRARRPPTTPRWSRRSGLPGRVVPGDPDNLKLTTPADLARRRSPAGGALSVRVGQGFDVHPFSDDPTGRWSSAGSRSPAGGASPVTATPTSSPTPWPTPCWGRPASATSGRHFPDTDPACAGADSLRPAGQVASSWRRGRLGSRSTPTAPSSPRPPGWPRIAPAMARRLTGAFGAPVSVKATRAEGLGALGRAEGIACLAVVLLWPRAGTPS